MGFPIPVLETQPRNFGLGGGGPVTPPPTPRVALVVPATDLVPDPVVALTVVFSVQRSGDLARDCQVDWAVAPTPGSGIPAATFAGGVYPAGTAIFVAGQASVPCQFQLAAGGQPVSDQFAALALASPVNCSLGTPASVGLRLPGKPIPVQDIVSVSVPVADWQVDPATHDYRVTVSRNNAAGGYVGGASVTLKLTGTGASPIVAGDLSGGLLNTVVTFTGTELSHDVTVSTLPGTVPTADRTGRVAVSAPVGCQLSPTAASVNVAIKTPVTVAPPAGVLPPEYTDFPLAGMTPINVTAAGGRAALTTQLNLLNGSANCKTKYIQLADDFDYGTTMFTISQSGYYDTAKKEKWPLIVAGGGRDTGRSTSKKASFRFLTVSGDCVAILLHQTSRPIDSQAASNGAGLETYRYQGINGLAIDVQGKDVFVVRCWLDCPRGVEAQGGIDSLTVAACDFYGAMATDPNTTLGGGAHVHLEIGSGTTAAGTKRPTNALIHNNFMSQLQEINNGGICMYTGNGRMDPVNKGTATSPYDINMRDCWFFNNCIMSERAWLVYLKHAMNIYRNRIYSLATWNAGVDATPRGNAYHVVTTRGPNEMGPKVKHNVLGGGQVSGLQGWNGEFDFNKFVNAVGIQLFIQMNSKDGKPLMGLRNWKFRGNRGTARVEVGSGRNNNYSVQGGVANDVFEDNPDLTFVFDAAGSGLTYDAMAGKPMAFGADGWNTQKMQGKDTGAAAFVDIVPVASVRNLPTTSEVAQLAVADDVLPTNTGLLTPTKLVWDGKGAGGGPGTTSEPANYDLVDVNMTTWWPYDDMPGNLPGSGVRWLADGGFELTATNNGTKHACMNIWHKKRPPDGDCTFTFYATLLDALGTTEATPEGIFALFRVRQKGIPAHGADPNGWAPASWRTSALVGGVPAYTTPGSDLIVRDRTTGHRHSFVNHADTVGNSMQCRLRKMDGGDDGVDNSTVYPVDTPNPIPTTGDSFLFVRNRKYKLVVSRVGTTETATKTDVLTPSLVQTWTHTHADLGPAGQAVGGWCGFNCSLGRSIRIEPVPGVPFCQ